MTSDKRQKQIFLESEADAWFERNQEALAKQNFELDPLCAVLLQFASPAAKDDKPLSILEVGCGEGRRLAWLNARLGASVFGIEPSRKAVEAACAQGVDARVGTADALPWESGSFDIVLFGFCLYLCDPVDLFRIAAEADRVLKSESWLVIHDFYATSHTQRAYHHKAGIQSNKMDYRKLFDWHPAYTCYSHRLSAHGINTFSDDPQEWVATSLLRKREL